MVEFIMLFPLFKDVMDPKSLFFLGLFLLHLIQKHSSQSPMFAWIHLFLVARLRTHPRLKLFCPTCFGQGVFEAVLWDRSREQCELVSLVLVVYMILQWVQTSACHVFSIHQLWITTNPNNNIPVLSPAALTACCTCVLRLHLSPHSLTPSMIELAGSH